MKKYSILLVIALSTSKLFCVENPSDSSQPRDKLNSTHEKYLKAYALLNGEGGEKDPFAARKILEQCALEGNAKAKSALGCLMIQGTGGISDVSKGIALLQEAAECGAIEAQTNLGLIYEKGAIVEKNMEFAIKWYLKAADSKSREALTRLVEIFYFGADDQIINHEKALPHVRTLAAMDNAWAQNILGTMLQHGQGVTVNLADSKYWYHEAALRNDAKAQSNLGHMIRNRATKDKEFAEAYQWLKLASDKNEPMALKTLNYLEMNLTPAQKALGEQLISEFQTNLEASSPDK